MAKFDKRRKLLLFLSIVKIAPGAEKLAGAMHFQGDKMTARPDLRSWDAWHQIHQVFELDWWRNALARGHYADDAAFEAQWAAVKAFIKPEGRILDIGCGPAPAVCAVQHH